MKKYSALVVFFFLVCTVIAQSSDVVRLEYTNLPEGETQRSTSRYRFLANLPIKLDDKNYIVMGAEYSFIDFDSDASYEFDNSELGRFKIIDINLGYIYRWDKDWTFIGLATPRLASNFTGKVQKDDLKLNFSAIAVKSRPDLEKPTRLVLGISYNSATGFPLPLPILSYYKKFHKSWSYMLGVPKMEFKYHLKHQHTFNTALLLDGYFVNVQNDIVLPDNDFGSGLSLSAVVGAVGYQYNINKNISFYGLVGHTLTQRGVLRDDKRNKVFSLYDDGNVYFRTGFKIGIL